MVSTNFPSNLFFARKVLDLTYIPLYKPRTLNIVVIYFLFQLLEMMYLENIENLN
jgi:hypothetical protein